jgi:hypothetical protein
MKKKLDMEEFLRLLSETPRTWRVTDEDRIRDSRNYCPLQAVTKKSFGYTAEAIRMGLTRVERNLIMESADEWKVMDMREKLLKACGLK